MYMDWQGRRQTKRPRVRRKKWGGSKRGFQNSRGERKCMEGASRRGFPHLSSLWGNSGGGERLQT